MQWPKEKGQKDKQRSTKHTRKRSSKVHPFKYRNRNEPNERLISKTRSLYIARIYIYILSVLDLIYVHIWVPDFTPGFGGVCVARSLIFCVVFGRSYICPFVLFFLSVIVLSVLLRLTGSDYGFDIFQLFLSKVAKTIGEKNWLWTNLSVITKMETIYRYLKNVINKKLSIWSRTDLQVYYVSRNKTMIYWLYQKQNVRFWL